MPDHETQGTDVGSHDHEGVAVNEQRDMAGPSVAAEQGAEQGEDDTGSNVAVHPGAPAVIEPVGEVPEPVAVNQLSGHRDVSHEDLGHATVTSLDIAPRSTSSEQFHDSSSVGGMSAFSTGLSIDDSSDADSSLGDSDRPSSSVSASSSIFDFVEEYGRTWHKYKEGKYFLPNDVPEQERLDLQHATAVRLFGKLALAPVENAPRVLDIGTGTGIWAIEFATENPASDVLGTDLSPIQPEFVPPNCRFEVDDADDEWVFTHKFDYIHSRFMIGAFGDFEKIFRYCYENTNPGGWVEFQDYIAEFQCVDDSLRGTALEKWNKLFLDAVEKTGRSGRSAVKFKNQMLRAGFVDVVERKFALPGNPWAKGEREKILGVMQMTNILEGLHGMTVSIFTKILGWTVEQVEVFLVDVRKDMKDTKIHFYYIVLAVYGRKPPLGSRHGSEPGPGA